MNMTAMPIRADGVGTQGAAEAPVPALVPDPSGDLITDIQHYDRERSGPTSMHTVCHCEVSHNIDVLRDLKSETMWLACHRGSDWIYGRCHCEKVNDQIRKTSMGIVRPPGSQSADAEVMLDYVSANQKGTVTSRVWRITTELLSELFKGLNVDRLGGPIPLQDVHSDYWEMSEMALAEFARVMDRQLPTQTSDGGIHAILILSDWPKIEEPHTKTKDSVEAPSTTINGQPVVMGSRLQSLNINEVRPVDVDEMAGRASSGPSSNSVKNSRMVQYPTTQEKITAWIQSMSRKGVVRRLRFKSIPIRIRLALQQRLIDLDNASRGIRDTARFTETAPVDTIYRPRTMIAMTMGRVHRSVLSILLDSGSGISVVSQEFADRSLQDCKTYKYDGPMVQVADESPVVPIGYIDAEVQIGTSRLLQRFVVFPKLPVDVLLGTDWLYTSKAVTDWGRQTLKFPESSKTISLKILQHTTESKLLAMTDVIVPPRSGKWVRAMVPKSDHLRLIPKAVVFSASDPWCARHRSLITPKALLTLSHGQGHVFLVNTSAYPMRVKKRNTIAIALPDVPEDGQIV